MAVNRTNKPPVEGWQERFLAHLRDTGNVRRSCEAADVARSWAYDLRAKDPTFAAEWKAAALDAADLIEETLLDRGLNGWEEPVFQGGVHVGAIRRYAHNVAMVILKASNPEKYAAPTELRHSGPDGGPIQIAQVDLSLYTDDELEALERLALRGAGQALESAGDPPGEGEAEMCD